MCMWFGFNPAVNFCHFSTLLTLSVFAGATSTSPKFDLFFYPRLSNLYGRTCILESTGLNNVKRMSTIMNI